MSKRILQTGLLVMVVISLAGCLREGSSDEFGEDVQSLDGPIKNNDSDRYRGRVMNGELQNALVWLDMDADGDFDSGEPAAFSDTDGRFELDVSGLKRPRTESPDLDPRDFPLMTVAIPGLTENARTGAIDRSFFLAAPPGVELVTPFTTMAETWRRLQSIEDRREAVSKAGTEITRRVSAADETIGVYSDYLVSGAERVPFYAEAFRRMIQAQIPDSLNSAIAGGASVDSPGELVGTGIPGDQIDVIGSILLDQSEPLINEVDDAIEMAGGVDGFQLPDLETVTTVGADLSNPWLVREQSLYLSTEEGGQFGTEDVPDDVRRAGIITHDYSVGTTLRRATSRGYFGPSMQPVIRMANEDGRVNELGAQPGLEFDLDNPKEGSVDPQDSADERFVFDWSRDGDLARLQSPQRLATIGLGDLADYEREDGDRTYTETASNGRVTQMERILGNEGDADYMIEESARVTTIGRSVYSLSIGEDTQRGQPDFTTCQDVDSGFEAENERVINAKLEITVSGDETGTETLYGHLRDDSGEKPAFRVLIREFVADGDNQPDNWRWEFEYYDDRDNGQLLSSQQPDLIRSIRLFEGGSALSSNSFCSEREFKSAGLSAFVAFEHISFTQYLEQIGTRN